MTDEIITGSTIKVNDELTLSADTTPQQVEEVLKPKRTRRTKAQIEADEAAAKAPKVDPMDALLFDVSVELGNQVDKWGVQDHPLIGGFEQREALLRRNYKAREVELQQQNKGRVAADTMGWDTILLEEVYEALSEPDPDKAVAELIQVAAVAINAADSIKRNAVSK